MFMFANNRDFGKSFKVKQKRVSVLFHEQLKTVSGAVSAKAYGK